MLWQPHPSTRQSAPRHPQRDYSVSRGADAGHKPRLCPGPAVRFFAEYSFHVFCRAHNLKREFLGGRPALRGLLAAGGRFVVEDGAAHVVGGTPPQAYCRPVQKINLQEGLLCL